MNGTALTVFILFFILVTVMGFLAARWRRGDLGHIDEWGLGGRRFGTLITWFLLGGDLYTAYTFIAVPALLYGSGATGFFAVPYTIIVYPFVFLVMPRMWSVAKKHGFVTAADFVKGRFDSHWLALAIAVTGILATLPYIALQLVGMQSVISAMGITGKGFMGELPLIIAFAILAVYTYTSGLRAPAMIAIVKDIMIYLTIIVVVAVVPAKLGGFGHIFSVAQSVLSHRATPGAVILSPKAYLPYATLALGSALALFLYPHSLTGTLSASGRKVVKRNAALLPIYSLVLAFITLMGYMAIADGINTKDTTTVVPLLLLHQLPSWFAGFAFAAIAIGALVPASIMSIAAANLFTRNIYKAYVRLSATPQDEARVAKLSSLVVKVGALLFIILLPKSYAINLQLLGGVWILQTLPAVILGLYTRWLHRHALLLGWAVGMIVGTSMAIANGFKSSIFVLHIGQGGFAAYAAVYALVANLIVAVVFTLIFNAVGANKGADQTQDSDYLASDASA
ncbi:monocarboxylate uptake permease MctP [Ferroacidibacillus organovorans]|uniref:Sodium:solute symporter n=1 Tax=Ferroacidibacillus organovorans TaxID=1765683 RepID=A0A101XNJ0_9BACL|nr:sodium:solute symporter [Ferroacidibacillus organovorans]KUO94673.1 sodium:solute symporter [Ferroacidibacillus organovorans]